MIRSFRTLLVSALVLTGGALSSPVLAEAPTCPGKTFDAFLTAFAEDGDIQRTYVADTVSWGQIDADADPEPRMVFTDRPKASLAFPVMPLGTERERDGLRMSTTRKDAGTVEVMLAKPDTGYQLRYGFRPAGSCWVLASVADESL